MIWTVVAASIAVYSWKILGYLVPVRFITPTFKAFADRVTIALLAALVGIQGFALEGEIVLDVRLASLGVAALMLWFRAPYILVVAAGAAVAAGLRILGL